MTALSAMSRRRLLALAGSLPVLGSIPSGVVAMPDLRRALEARLATPGLPFPATLTLCGLERNGSDCAAVVRMTWAPGFRVRKVAVSGARGASEADLAEALHAEIRRVFAAAAGPMPPR